jgi:cytochrome o ubiquinol oxidase subunit 2
MSVWFQPASVLPGLSWLKRNMSRKYKLGLLLVLLAVVVAIAVHYLRTTDIAVFSPRGPIAQKERNLIVFTLALSLIVVIPVFVLLAGFAWRYREGNPKAKYSPNLDHSAIAETVWWLVPTVLIVILSVVTWQSSHSLDPFRAIDSSTPPITIQVVAMDWKWLFIYPQQNIAAVNYVQFPVNTPVNFQITSDAPMNSFWIPQLAGQIYAMPGMSTQLHLMATQTGSFRGSSANISGQGFAGMDFIAKASSKADFETWLSSVKKSAKQLDVSSYNTLAKPSSDNPVAYYSSEQSSLFGNVMMKYMMPGMAGYLQ